MGITPARAGKRGQIAEASTMMEDHPRTRGEKALDVFENNYLSGSPPHARGKALSGSRKGQSTGITPARAGKRNNLPLSASPRGGSPPHARGKDSGGLPAQPQYRITPARAGKSFPGVCSRPESRDHPRTRGEKWANAPEISVSKGSPPHARGKAKLISLWLSLLGITPARAGKSGANGCAGVGAGDHPRTRGEKTKRIPILSHCFQGKESFSFSFS